MEYFGYSTLCLLVTALIGWPIALLALPRRLKPQSLLFAPLLGYAYIVFTCHWFYLLNAEGTNSYALLVFLPPSVAIVFLASLRRLQTGPIALPVSLYLVSFVLMSMLFLLANGTATSFSLGNLDIVESATDTRFLQEFARDSTAGFLGQSSELKSIVDSFWGGQSHHTAFLSSVIGAAPYQIQSLAMALIAAQGSVFVWLIARDGLALGEPLSAGVTLLYAVNPVVAYTLWMAFAAQSTSMPLMLAAIYLFMMAMQEVGQERWRYAAPLVIIFSGLLVNYYYMLVIIGALLIGYLVVLAVVRWRWSDFWSGVLLLLLCAIATLALNPLRAKQMIEHLQDLVSGNNGWFIPWLSPEFQIGVSAVPRLFNEPLNPLTRLVAAAFVAMIGIALALQFWRERQAERIAFVLGLAVPALVMGFALGLIGAEAGHLGGYRSFKITGTFVGLTLLSLALPFSGRGATAAKAPLQVVGVVLFVIVFVVDLMGLSAMVARQRHSGYIMPADFPQIQKLESMPFAGVNFMDTENFDLFWAHYFSLKKRQVFARFPYSGRPVHAFDQPYTVIPKNPPLGLGPGASTDIFFVEPRQGEHVIKLNSRLDLILAEKMPPLSIRPDIGWWGKEPTHRWTGAAGRISKVAVSNQGPPLRVQLVGRFGDLRPGDGIQVQTAGVVITAKLTRNTIETEPFELPQGTSLIEFIQALEPIQAPPPDPRKVGVMWHELHLEPVQ